MERGWNDIDSENTCSNEGQVIFTSNPPTLQSIASIALVAKLWTEPEMIRKVRFMLRYPDCPKPRNDPKKIRKFFQTASDPVQHTVAVREQHTVAHSTAHSGYHNLEKKVLNQITKLLPNPLLQVVSSLVWPVGNEFVKWLKNDFYNIFSFNDIHPDGGAIYWTREGNIDKVKTLKGLINSEIPTRDYCKLYELACKYCLEEYMLDLWDKIPMERKEKFDLICMKVHIRKACDDYIVAYWTFTLRNEWHIMTKNNEKYFWNHSERRYFIEDNPDCCILKIMILWSIRQCNLIAFKLFWQKFVEERENTSYDLWLEQLAFKTALKLNISLTKDLHFEESILKFLLPYVRDTRKQKQIFRTHSTKFLSAFFKNRPFQGFSKPSPLLPLMLNNIFPEFYEWEITKASNDLLMSADVFEEVWSVTPINLKQRLFEVNDGRSLVTSIMLSLMKTGHLNSALTVVKDIPQANRERILHFIIKNRGPTYYIEEKIDLDLLDILLMELLPTEKNLESIKQEYMQQKYESCKEICREWLLSGKIEYVRKFLKWAFQSEMEIENFKLSLPFNRIFIKLISIGNYDHVHQFVNWYLAKDREIHEIKNLLCDEENLKSVLDEFGEQGKRSISLFYKFKNYCISNFASLISELKKLCIKHLKYLVKEQYWDLASAILNWCFHDEDEADQYITELILSECELYINSPYDLNMIDQMIQFLISSKPLIKWALPFSRETITELKSFLS